MENAAMASDNTHTPSVILYNTSQIIKEQVKNVNLSDEDWSIAPFTMHDKPNEAAKRIQNGQSSPFSYLHLTSLFRTPPPGPGMYLTARTRNKLMKSYNGNKRKVAKPVNVAPSFNVIHQNIQGGNKQSLSNVGTCIDKILKRFHPAILFLSEVDPAMVEANTPPGYTFIKGTLQGKDNVRICALTKVTEKFEILDLNLLVPTVAIKILGWIFMGCYREWTWGADPATKQRRDLELIRLKSLIKYWRSIRGKGLIMGDFNYDPRDPQTTHQKSLNDIRDIMEAEITDRGWRQYVQEITRSREGEEPAILDHIYCNQDDFIEHQFLENVTGSDHYAVGAKIRLTAPVFISQTFFCRAIKKIPPGEFENIFCTSRIYEVYRAADVNEALAILEFKIIRALNIVAPMKRVKTREHYAKWLTPELLIKIKRRNAMRRRAEKSKDKKDWKIFKDYQKVLSKQLREARHEDLKADLSVRNSKDRWKAVRLHANIGKKGQKKEQEIELNLNGELVTESNRVAHSLNTYFKEKVINLRKDLNVSVENSLKYTDEYLAGREVPGYELKQVSRTYVKKVIRNLTNTGAMGRDGISTEVLKRYRHVITGPLTHIINMSIYHGKYPDAWKLGHITPLPKDGDRKDPKNWRPICINCAMSKVLETVINDQISNYMEVAGLYSKTQHAYRQLRSVSTALIELDTILRDQLNKGRTCAILTTDISAGFNLVSKEILVPKMAKFGFGENSCKLLNDYLTGRRTKVKIKNFLSGEVQLETGVGEGSVLGPNFFSCGMTDISVVAKRVVKKLKEEQGIEVFISQIEYADDTTGLLGAKNEEELQIAVDALLEGFSQFYSANGLKLNQKKCHVLVVRPRKKVRDITCAGQVEVQKLRLLGLFIDNKLEYAGHTKVVCGRLTAKLLHLEALKSKASYSTLKEVTVSLIHSTIEFCAELYMGPHQNQVKVQKKLNSVMRMLLSMDFDSSCAEMMFSLRWLNSSNMRRWCMLRTLKRILSCPSMVPHVWDLLNLNQGPMHNVRYNALKLHWRKYTRWARDSYVYQSTDLYNRLGLHGRGYEDYADMRDSIKLNIKLMFGNKNVK